MTLSCQTKNPCSLPLTYEGLYSAIGLPSAVIRVRTNTVPVIFYRIQKGISRSKTLWFRQQHNRSGISSITDSPVATGAKTSATVYMCRVYAGSYGAWEQRLQTRRQRLL